jgi:Protein of unknown function (DUF3999)
MKQRNEMFAGIGLKNVLRWLLDIAFPLTPALSLGERGRRAGVFSFSNTRLVNPAASFSLWRTAILPLPKGEGRAEGKGRSQTSSRVSGLIGLICLCTFSFRAAALPSDWQHEQRFDVATPGLVKFSLPAETLNAARPALEDLRLYDAAGHELPFFIDRPTPASKVIRAAKSFQVSLNANMTVITLETGLTQPLDGVSLETPAGSFIKAVRIEGSADGKRWQMLATGQPVFREPSGASQLRVTIPPGVWHSLRLTVDDARTQPIPFTGARIFAAAAEATPMELQPATIAERNENPGETRLTLNLGAANLVVASVQIETDEPLFTRLVTLAVPVVSEDALHEQTIGEGCVYRIAVEGQKASENLSVPLENRVPSRELILIIKNSDSPPLAITGVRVERRPVNLMFMARAAGSFHLLMGNSRCAAPRYDLASLGAELKNVAVTPVKISALADNSDFRAPEALAGVELGGTALDVADWKYRKPVKISSGGAQQLEPDLDVLAHAQPGFADLRVMHGSNQVPYIVQYTSINRALTPSVTPTNDAKQPKLSRWMIKLPQAGLPLTRLSCETRTALFQRDVTLYEELTDERGEKYRRNLGGAAWTQTPDRKSREFALPLNERLQSDTLFFETENGDNPSIELEKFVVIYPATRALFKAKAGDELFLYYGNPRVFAPRYDLSLLAGELLATDKKMATLSDEQQLKKSLWRENQTPGKGGAIFWGILALVVVVLLMVIFRLLPKAQTPPSG